MRLLLTCFVLSIVLFIMAYVPFDILPLGGSIKMGEAIYLIAVVALFLVSAIKLVIRAGKYILAAIFGACLTEETIQDIVKATVEATLEQLK